jgi:hypothetical protein
MSDAAGASGNGDGLTFLREVRAAGEIPRPGFLRRRPGLTNSRAGLTRLGALTNQPLDFGTKFYSRNKSSYLGRGPIKDLPKSHGK